MRMSPQHLHVDMCIQELEIPKWEPVSLLHRTAALGGEGMCSPCAASCWFDIRCFKAELCVVEAVAEKHYINLH